MIGSRHRFHGHTSLRNLYAHSQTIRLSSLILLRYQPTNRRFGYRAAVVVSRKTHKSAVVRNRIRRRVYATLTRLESQIGQPYDLVFLVLSEAVAKLPYNELEELVYSQLVQAGVIIRPVDPEPAHDIVEKVQKED
jgi:ribonuclease P protein component